MDADRAMVPTKQAFGIALKLTFAGNNQLTHPSTYLFGFTVLGCILVQMVRARALHVAAGG
jgi:hypothetical protein